MSDFKKGLLWTAGPIVALSIASAILTAFRVMTVFFIPLLAISMVVLAIVAAIAVAIAGKRRLAAGILAGVGIGIVAIGATCFARPFTFA